MGVPATAGGRLVLVGTASQDDNPGLAPVAAVDDGASIGNVENARIGQHVGAIAKYEVGERRIDVVEFCEIADALNLNASALLASLFAGSSKLREDRKSVV